MIETLIFLGAIGFIIYGFVKSSEEKRREQYNRESREELVQRMLDDYR